MNTSYIHGIEPQDNGTINALAHNQQYSIIEKAHEKKACE